MPPTQITTKGMEKRRQKVTEKISRKQRSFKKDHKKEEQQTTNLPSNKNLHSVGRTDSKKKAKPVVVVDPAFSKVEMPSLFCFSMNLQEIAPDMTKSGKLLDHEKKLKMKERKRLIFTKKLHKMYQLAMAHQATFSRILAKHSDDFGPDMDPLGSVKVYQDKEEENSSTIATGQLNEKIAINQEGRKESYTELKLNATELMKTLDTTIEKKELTLINSKQLVYIDPIIPIKEEMADSSNEANEALQDENDSLTNNLDMLSVKDSRFEEEKIPATNLGINNELLLENKDELNIDRNVSNEKEIFCDKQGKSIDNDENPVDNKIVINNEDEKKSKC